MITRISRSVPGHGAGASVLAAMVGVLCHAAMPASAADVFLSMKDASGAVVDTDATHSWVELVGFEQGTGNESSLRTGTPVKGETAGECSLMLRVDRSVGDLMNACTKGSRMHLKLHVVQPSSSPPHNLSVMTELNFENTFITSVKGDMRDGDVPVFMIGLKYSKMTWAFTWIDNKGQAVDGGGAGFDFATQRVYAISSGVPSLGDYVPGGGSTNPDEDNDGMPDAWERANGLNPTNPADANEDRDKDGQSNKDEYVAGTNPNSGASFFRATVQGPGTSSPGQVTLSWNSVAGKSYRIMASDTLDGAFVQVATVQGLANETSHTLPASTAKRFFKITVE
ncbi:type VI secretion system tube protein Hcp [Luteolibacter flavescens]|uniref:Type VI secretion system tube protein Hcp n=1 Tax=Luteolibacter flavescens TaxID=1859460 RepID=A0ABT3FTE1_9BACT|nr:type VI secretion system tube protein Hcp [Luteolibacter flavescens]MCW1886589.1 type VI secretion system tube protein Hcp [Luteolibacter flavescens]